MAFVRFKGPYAYLVANARAGRGARSRVAQRVLCYLGRGPDVDEATIAKVKARYPDLAVDWEAVRAELAAGARAPSASPRGSKHAPAASSKPALGPAPAAGDEWADWD